MPELDQRLAGVLPGPPAGKADLVHWDDRLRGFGLRVWASGKRIWIVRYRIGKRQRVVTLGAVGEITAAAARRRAGEVLASKRLGHDERQSIDARKANARRPAERTLHDLIAAYKEHVVAKQKPRTQIETRRHLERHWQPLHRTVVSQLGRAAIAARLLELAKVSGPVAGNRARAALSAVFSWSVGVGLAEHNPVIGTVRHDERSRDRVLAPQELRLIWRATEDMGDHNTIVRLLMLTGQRREEVASLGWSELDLENLVWTLPRSRSKNGRAHEVPLSPQVIEILCARPRRDGRDLILGGGAAGFSGWSHAKVRLDRRIEELAGRAIPPWVLHDLRRTVVTGLAGLGVQPHVIEAVVNHISGHKAGVAGVYNRATYSAEKRAALQAWADCITSLVTDKQASCAATARDSIRRLISDGCSGR